jgi:hypothetical protein
MGVEGVTLNGNRQLTKKVQRGVKVQLYSSFNLGYRWGA